MVGVGGFGRFCLQALQRLPELRLIAVSDVNPAAARAVAQQLGVRACSFDDLLNDPAIDVIHLTTPPAAHAAQAIAALKAGKHVFCEKPLATTAEDAHAMLRAAATHHRRLGVDYVLRYHPLWQVALALVRSGLFGRAVRWHQENLASDQRLPREHWFWDRSVSGGIFVEHAVHFFDLCNQLTPAPATQVMAQSACRPDGAQDRVLALVRYADGLLATFYHSFDRPDVLERSTVRIGLEQGSIELYGWIPERLQVEGLLDAQRLSEVQHLLDTPLELVDPATLPVIAFDGARPSTSHLLVRATLTRAERMDDYRAAIAAGMRDFLRALGDATHRPLVSAGDGWRSLQVALAATHAADIGMSISLPSEENLHE